MISSSNSDACVLSAMEQPHHRREPRLCSFLVVMGFACFVALTSCLHSSLCLHQNLLGTAASTETGASSFDEIVVEAPIAVTTKKSALEGQGRPHQRLGVKKRERSRVMMDSSRTDNHGNGALIAADSLKPLKKKNLDFIIAGFPKTGTTSLLYAFGDHPETDIASKERCAITNPMASDFVALGKLKEAMSELSGSPRVKRAIKCPNAVYHAYSAIVRLEQHAHDAKFVIGVRHPIDMLQSYYNYRVTEMYDNHHRQQKLLAKTKGSSAGKLKKMEAIPPLDSLIGAEKEWKGVSTDSTRFELYLRQFGKTKVQASELEEMVVNTEASRAEKKQRHLAIKPNSFSMFLYTVDQLEDTGNAKRSKAFRSGLQNFLGLEKPLKPVGRENLNHFVGRKAHRETVNICLPKYSSLRRVLVKQGARSAHWIEHEFLRSPDVVVANREHFIESIRLWGEDPCDNRRDEKKIKKKALQAHGRKTKKHPDDKVKQRKRLFVGKHRRIEVIPVSRL